MNHMTPRTAPVLRALLPPLRRPRAITNRRHAARSTVLCGLALVALAFLSMALAVETVKPEWRDPEYGHRLKQLQALRKAHPNRPLIVAVGSSRTQMGVSPAAMEVSEEPGSPLVYNFGQSGAGPLHILLTVQRLLDDGVKPDFFLIELFPATLAHDGPAEQQFEKILPRLSHADLRRLEPFTQNPAALRKQWAENRVNSWHSHRISLMSHWQPNWLPWQHRLTFQWQQMDAFGYTRHPVESVSDLERDWHFANEYFHTLHSLHIGNVADRAIRELVARCRVERIPVAFYLMPESPRFQEGYSVETRAKVAGYCDMLTHELGAPVFDASNDFAETEFADGHHLLRHGASRFSRRLFAECVSPWVGAAKR